MMLALRPPASALAPMLALALPLLAGLATPAAAQTSCSGGTYAGDALVVPDPEIGAITRATQYAWDGGGNLVEVCNLLTEGADFFATWSLFSGEVDLVHPGICVSLTTEAGEQWYSCQGGQAVAAAFGAAGGSEASVLRFEAWEPAAPTIQ